jgi:hypothetical protein
LNNAVIKINPPEFNVQSQCMSPFFPFFKPSVRNIQPGDAEAVLSQEQTVSSLPAGDVKRS